MTRPAVNGLGQPNAAGQGEPLLRRAIGTLPPGTAKSLALPEALQREPDAGEQRAGDQHQVHDGNGDGNDGSADARRERETGPLEAIAGAKDADIDQRRSGHGPHGPERYFDRTQAHLASLWEPIEIR